MGGETSPEHLANLGFSEKVSFWTRVGPQRMTVLGEENTEVPREGCGKMAKKPSDAAAQSGTPRLETDLSWSGQRANLLTPAYNNC